MRKLVQFVPNSIIRHMATLVANNAQRAAIPIPGQETEVLLVRHALRLATVPTRPRSPAPMAPIKSRPLVTPVTGWSEMRVVHVQLIHMPFKATMRRVKPVRQGHTPTPVLAPPAPPVVLVLRVAKVPTRPRSRVLRAPIKLRPPVTLVMVLLWIVATCKEFRDCANHNLFCDVLATDIFTF